MRQLIHALRSGDVPWSIGSSPVLQLAALGAFFVVSGAWNFGCLFAARFVPGAAFAADRWVVFAGAQACGLLSVLAVIGTAPPRGHFADKLGLYVPKRGDWGVVITGLAACYLFQFVATPLWDRALGRLGVECVKSQELLRMCEALDGWRFAGVVLLLGVLVPVTEEVLYRRLLFGALRPLGTFWALALSSLIFSAMHWYLYGFWTLWALGVSFQCISLRCRNLGAGMAAHMIFNMVTLLAVFLGVVRHG